MRFEVRGMPDSLPPGKYRTRVSKESRWTKDDLVIVVDFVGPYDDNDPCLFPLTKEDVASERAV